MSLGKYIFSTSGHLKIFKWKISDFFYLFSGILSDIYNPL